MKDFEVYEQRNALIAKCQAEGKSANRRAKILRAATSTANFLIVVAGLGVGFAGVVGGLVPSAQEGALYTVTVLGFALSAVKGVLAATNAEERAIVNKQRAVALNALARRLHRAHEDTPALAAEIAQAERQLDEMELDSFGGGSPKPKHLSPFGGGAFQPGQFAAV